MPAYGVSPASSAASASGTVPAIFMTKGEAIAAELTIMNFLRVTFDSVMVFSLRADMFLAAYNRFPGEATGLQ